MTGHDDGPNHESSNQAVRTHRLLALLIFALIVLVLVRVFFG
jgi:predicted nucleic acid-binding Zn ribbon protein